MAKPPGSSTGHSPRGFKPIGRHGPFHLALNFSCGLSLRLTDVPLDPRALARGDIPRMVDTVRALWVRTPPFRNQGHVRSRTRHAIDFRFQNPDRRRQLQQLASIRYESLFSYSRFSFRARGRKAGCTKHEVRGELAGWSSAAAVQNERYARRFSRRQ